MSRSKRAYTSLCTMNRFALMQDCPLFSVRALTAVLTAVSRSADGITMKASLPPSSRTVGLMSFPACAATAEPAGSLPVSVAAATRGSSSTRLTAPAPMRSDWNTPSGNPALRSTSSMASAERGTFDACFRTPGVAGHQRRRDVPEHLPEREVPRHHREHHPERQVLHVARLRLAGDHLVAQSVLRLLGVVATDLRALLCLGDGRDRASSPSPRSSCGRAPPSPPRGSRRP